MVWRTRLSHKKNLSDVIRTGGHVIVIQFCGIALGFILQILLARWLGPGNYGAYVYSFAWITIVSILCGVGLPTSSVRFISENLEKKNWAQAKGFYRWSLFLAICCSVLIMVFGFVTFGIYKSFLPRGVEGAFYISLLCIPFLSLLRLNIGVFRGFGYAVLAYWPDKLGRPALLIMAILAMEYFSIEMTAANVVIATALVLFILCVVQITIGEYRVPSAVRQSTAEYENSRWLKVSLPLVLVAGFQVIIDRTDLIVLGMYLDADTIAIYNAAARTAGLVVVILTAMNALSGAKIAALYNTGDLGGLHALINGVVKWTFWPSLLLALLVMLLSDEIMSIFGAGFRDGKYVLIVLAISQLINAAAGPVMLLMNMTGNQNSTAIVLGVTALINLGLNILFVPLWGSVGAAFATGSTMVIWNLLLALIVKKRIGINCFVFSKN